MRASAEMYLTVIEMSLLLQLLCFVILNLGVADGQNVPVIETHTVLQGEPLSLICPLTITMDWLVWKHDGNVISYYSEGSTTDKSNISVKVEVQKSISTLELNNIGFTDAGNYSCNQYELSSSTESKNREWRVQVQGQLAVTLNATSTVEGENISATCCVEYASYSKYDNVGYFWSVNEDPLTVVSTTQERIERNENRRNACSSVMFRSLSIYNAKMLVCRTSSFPNHFSTAVLNVQYKPVVHKLPRDDELYVKIGKEIKIICNVNGNPNPNVSLEEKLSNETWQTSRMKPSRVIQESVTTKFGVTFSWRVKEESLVFYRCMTENFLGTSYSDETEVISYKGIWSRGRFFITAAVLLTICVAAATIFWIKTMRKSGVDIARKESIISLHYNRELNDGDYETEAGDNQIADVSNSYMAVEGKV
ncbi:uncharacterized protein [Apostichopus japonicus]|uniref:uncharacterized protein n=1 Tax=Stichopus japonicus TaxID=307972 RepID=UPI003AB408DA